MRHFDKLGYEVRDLVTGYKGIAESISFDLYGCCQIAVRPPLPRKTDKPGEYPEGRYFDAHRLVVTGKKPVMKVPDFSDEMVAPVPGKNRGPADRAEGGRLA
jgi:hypothetical protein